MAFDLFFYGTLRDATVRQIVLGLNIPSAQIEPAVLEGYRCAPVDDGRFPALVRSVADSAQGTLVRNVPIDAAIRVSHFEGEVADYAVAGVDVRLESGHTVPAWVYFPTKSLHLCEGYWSIEEWQQTHRAGFVEDAVRHMERTTPGQLNAYRDAWRSRLNRSPGSG